MCADQFSEDYAIIKPLVFVLDSLISALFTMTFFIGFILMSFNDLYNNFRIGFIVYFSLKEGPMALIPPEIQYFAVFN